MLSGYAGKIGWINLSEGTSRITDLEEDVAKKYLGGKGIGAYLLYRYLRAYTDPFSPDNLLIFVTGPLTGTSFPAVSRSGVITKSPLTGTFLDSYSGGFFGTQLKWSGFDALIIQGRAEKPVLIMVDNGEITINEADHLWGYSTSETEKLIKDDLHIQKGERISIASIGKAGENLVRFANIINEKRAHGRGGAGAVMGSKKLKAVVLRGSKEVTFADEEAFKSVVFRCRQNIAEHPLVGKGKVFPKMGTMMTVDVTQMTGTLPTRNWQENSFDHSEQINGESFLNYAVRPRSCFGCPIGCSRDTKAVIQGGQEFITEGPDYETIYSFGSNCDVKDPEIVIAADRLCDDYGMDTISCGVVIGFAMECFEKGLITKEETGGIDLSFGKGESLLQIIHLIAKRIGIGEILSGGVKRASEKIEGSGDFAMHVKGMELPGYDPRGMKGQALTYALADRGACHVRSNTLRTELLGLPELLDRFAYKDKAEMVRKLQLSYVTFDTIITCIFGALAVTLKDYAEAISAVTGRNITDDDLSVIAERIWNLTRLFNIREGFSREEDTLPERLFSQASTKGPSKGELIDRNSFHQMLDEYYDLAGWDKSTGKPLKSKLESLGIKENL